MQRQIQRLSPALLLLWALTATAEFRYVNLANPNPYSPYTTWATAATNIQDAVDIAVEGDVVLVTNGVYATGGRVVYGLQTNRVVVDKAITLQSVNGAAATAIRGGTLMRCAYLASNAVLTGFTITNGQATRGNGDLIKECSGGGVWCEPGATVANCLLISNFTCTGSIYIGNGGGAYGGTLTNCTLTRNTSGLGGGAGGPCALWNCALSNNVANTGGGARGAALYNCILRSNVTVYYNGSAGDGGGISQCIASNCSLVGNLAGAEGGGAYQGTNLNCTAIGNAAFYGGGTSQSTNYNCVISGNSANTGGGAFQATLRNCVLTDNVATNWGGGAYLSGLVNCTVSGNTAASSGGGIFGGSAYNSIIYFNTAAGGGANWTNNPLMFYCCTAPLYFASGNITNAPVFVDADGGDFRVKCGSPTIDAGLTNASFPGTPYDIRGIARPLDGNGDSIAKLDMGAYEYDPAADQQPGIRGVFGFTTFATDYPVPYVAQIGGCADYFWWDFGDGVTATNQPSVTHAWSSPGTFLIVLSAHYPSLGQTLSATTAVQVVSQPVYYVNAANPSPQSPYTNWAKAATSVQTAIGAGTMPGRLVLVTNGLYQPSGIPVNGSIYNGIALTNAVVVRSVNGPGSTVIQPGGGRCAFVGSNSFLIGFTLTGGHTLSTGDVIKDQSGGGSWSEPGGVVSNCVIKGNMAYHSGGGGYQGTFYNCIFTNNWAYTSGSVVKGGGVCQAVLYDCLLISNRVSSSFPGGKGGGSYDSTLYNCQLIGNNVNNGDLTGTGGGAFLGTLYSCLLAGNVGSGYGGGTGSNTLWNCILSGNWANNGGGAYASTLQNCLVTGNAAYSSGGGTHSGLLNNCTLAANTAGTSGGGVSGSALTNCIVYLNTVPGGASSSNWTGSTFRWSCSSPLPSGTGNIANDPQFVSPADGDLHLLPGSRCINAGTNASVLVASDLDGNPRIMGGTVDMGAYETQASVTGTLTAWLQRYGLAADGSADFTDDDGDGASNWQEWWTDTIPTNSASALRILYVTPHSNGLDVAWEGVATRSYWLERSSDLGGPTAFQCIATNLAGLAGANSFSDTGATNGGPYFYRAGVR
jgi:parallel beta-helix repeat protein